MIVGTAGHIDHGKTALVGQLTGADTDRLKEEKARGLSIDLGFAYLPAPDGTVIGFVDVPGHERFIRNMLAGAAAIDFVMLVVAADDGIMPQTREHLAIIDLIGVRLGVVVLTKRDRVPPARLGEVAAEIRVLLAGTELGGADVIPVSNRTGEGIATLRARLFAAACRFRRESRGGAFRMAVDRAFSLSGIGTIATGAVLTGSIAVGERVVVSPAGLKARVRSIHAQNRPSERAVSGERAALNLAGEDIHPQRLRRGDVVLEPWLHGPTSRIDARLRLLATEASRPRPWTPVRLHHATAEVAAHMVLLDAALAPGGSGWVQLVLERPIAAAVGDSFILRAANASRTIAGGRFADLRAPARHRRSAGRLDALEALAEAAPAAALARLVVGPPFHVDPEAFARDRALPMADLEAISRGLGLVVLDTGEAGAAFDPEYWGGLGRDVAGALGRFHADHPDRQGMAREELRQQVAVRLPAAVFAGVLARLAEQGEVALDGAWVRLPAHQVRFSAAQESLWRRVQPMLGGEARFRPPRVREISATLDIPEAEIRRLLKVASRIGRVDEVAADHFFLRSAIAEIVCIAVEMARAAPGQAFAAAALRDRLGSGRKVAIRILEFLDRHGVTRRSADLRRIDAARCDLFGGPRVTRTRDATTGKGNAPGGVSGLQIREGP